MCAAVGEPCGGIIHDDGEGVIGLSGAESGPREGGCADIANAFGGITPAAVFVLIRCQPMDSAFDECVVAELVESGFSERGQRDDRGGGGEGAGGQFAFPETLRVELFEECGGGGGEGIAHLGVRERSGVRRAVHCR